ncbi:hypothetical protein PSPO01_11678 [Paraphaeosphaeria sporulosa]
MACAMASTRNATSLPKVAEQFYSTSAAANMRMRVVEPSARPISGLAPLLGRSALLISCGSQVLPDGTERYEGITTAMEPSRMLYTTLRLSFETPVLRDRRTYPKSRRPNLDGPRDDWDTQIGIPRKHLSRCFVTQSHSARLEGRRVVLEIDIRSQVYPLHWKSSILEIRDTPTSADREVRYPGNGKRVPLKRFMDEHTRLRGTLLMKMGPVIAISL